MPTRCQMYPTADAAREAAEALLAEGTSAGELHILIGTATRNVRVEPVGSFEGTVEPDDQLGTFAGPTVQRNQTPGGWGGERTRRRGSFGDSEHDEVVSFDKGGEHERTVDRHALMRLLEPVTADHEEADKLIGELHDGHALLLIGPS